MSLQQKTEKCMKNVHQLDRLCKEKAGEFKMFLPDVKVFLSGKLLSEVTLLLSADKATDGRGVGVSE